MRPWIAPLIDELVPRAASFAVRFVSDREMRRLNGSYRGHDRPTDVLSFPGDLMAPAGHAAADGEALRRLTDPSHLGDVVISVPTARRQAGELGHSTEIELRTLLLHGVLHCLGHDHETDDGTMERLEQRLRLRHIGDE
ncbi:MAG: rRNA maturation RNase YbeY [Acidobacteriota bacterium]